MVPARELISNPSAFVLGKPGLGKSTIVRRMATGLAGYGVMPLVLGDLKPDYVDLIEALGGQVITLGRGRGYLNILDPGEATEAAARLREAGFEKEASQVLADAHGRRHTMVSALLTILRSTPPTDREETIIDRALKHLDEHHHGVPVLGDLLRVIQDGPRRCAPSLSTAATMLATRRSRRTWKPPSSAWWAVGDSERRSHARPPTRCAGTPRWSTT